MVTRLPQAPSQAAAVLRVRRGLAVIPCDDGVIFCGGVWGKKIVGRDARRVLVPVARLLDGTRTITEVTAATGFTEAAVRQVIRTLADQELLETVDASAEGAVAAPLAAYLAKTFNPLSAQRTVSAALTVMSAASAAVIAPAEMASRICQDLRSSGIGTVQETVQETVTEAVGPASAITGAGQSGSHTAALVHDDGGDRAAQAIRNLLASQVPVLRFRVGRSAIEIGPVFYPGCPPSEQACHECLRRSRQRIWDDDPVAAAAADDAGVMEAGCALVATEALAILGELGDITTFRTLSRLTWPELEAERYVLVPAPECPSCGRDSAPGSGLPGAYEYEVQRWPSFVRKAESPSVRQKRRLGQLQSMRTPYPSSPRIPLPAGDPVLADILRRTAGKRQPGNPADQGRWTASGGNLASVELYLITGAGLCGWPAGTVFRYDDEAHELTVTMRGELSPRAGDGDSAADYTIILVGAFGRIGYKYGAFSLRLCLLDAGCALAQLSALAALHGLGLSVAPGWHPSLPAAIELMDGREVITAVADLYRNEGGHATGQ